MMKQKKKSSIPSLILGSVLAGVFILGVTMFQGWGSERHYSTVPTYDLMVRDVQAGDETIRIPEMSVFPEDEYYYMVSYKGGWPGMPAHGYLIHSKSETLQYRVECHPLTDSDSALEPNLELLGTPVQLSETDTVKNDFWVKQFIFDLGTHRYWVRFESREGIIEDVQPKLEKIALSILSA